MRILLVLGEPPIPEGGAPGRAGVALVRGLRDAGADLAVVSPRQHFSRPGTVPDDLGVEIVDVPFETGLRVRLQEARQPIGTLGRGVFGARVRELAASADVVHLETSETGRCDTGATPAALHLHYRARLDRQWGRPGSPQFRELLKFDRLERAVIRRHQWLLASSQDVAATLRRDAPGSQVALIPMALDPAPYEPAPLSGPPTVGIIGTGSWPPTANAARRLVDRVFPMVRRAVPEARLLVAGRGMAKLGLDGPGVEVVGEVESAPAFLRSLSMLLYPLERGSGVKVKVLEAIASGLPVVTTPRGAEGIADNPGVIVLDDDGQLAAAAVEVLRDGEARRERGAAARAAFDRAHTPSAAAAELLSVYGRMTDRR